MEQIKENIRTMLDQIAAQDPAAADTFQDIVMAKVSAAVENMKADVGQQFFNQSGTELSEGSMDKMSLSDLWHKHAGANYSADQGYGKGFNSMEHNEKAAAVIKNYVTKKYGKEVADDMEDHSNTSTYKDEYADHDESKKAEKHMKALRQKHGIKHMFEEAEQIDEISGATLGSYIQKARAQDNDKRVHGNELDQLPKVKAEKEKIRGWYADKRYKSNGESVHRAKINKAYDRIEDIKKKADPNYPESVIPKRHKGIGKAIQKLQYGKMSEGQEHLQEYHAAGTVNGKPWSVAYSDYPEHSTIAASNKHLSKAEIGAISSHIDQHSDDDFSGTKSTQNGHVVHVTHNGGSHGE